MTKLDWEKANRIKALNKEEIARPLYKTSKKLQGRNAYMGLIDAIKKIKNKDWIKNKKFSRKSLSKQERYRNALYKKLHRHTQELVELDSAFKNTKLYEQALDIYSKDDRKKNIIFVG